LDAGANEALVEAGHAGAGGLVRQRRHAHDGDKDEQQQEGDDDLLSEWPPPCRTESQFAERCVKVCARRERKRLNARLTHRSPPEANLPPTAIVEGLAHET
jgi:hypothetical protein